LLRRCGRWGCRSSDGPKAYWQTIVRRGDIGGERPRKLNITETNRRIAERFNEAFNRGDLDAAANCFAEDCQNHGRKVGRAGVRTVLGEIKTNFPDARLTTLNTVAAGEWVVVRCIYSGTDRGTPRFPVDRGMLVGVNPTGRTFEVQPIHMNRMLNGKIAEPLRIGTILE
jgi:predicted ester cyclase